MWKSYNFIRAAFSITFQKELLSKLYTFLWYFRHIITFIKLKYLMSKPKNFDASKYVRKNLDVDTVGKLKEVFDVFDYDGSGQISTEELVNTIKALNLESQAGQILGIVNAAGISGDFDFGTFLDVFGFGSDTASEGTLQTVFEAFDTTGSGAFGPEEFDSSGIWKFLDLWFWLVLLEIFFHSQEFLIFLLNYGVINFLIVGINLPIA